MPNFAIRMKELRESLPGELSQLDFAKVLSSHYPEQMGKMTDRTISEWESGKSPPRWSNFLLLAQFFDVSLNYLAGDDAERGHAPKIDEDAVFVPAGASSEDAEAVAEAVAGRKASPRPKRKPRRSTRRPES
jgi:transcriptional regulator with XRE-family HTH domain